MTTENTERHGIRKDFSWLSVFSVCSVVKIFSFLMKLFSFFLMRNLGLIVTAVLKNGKLAAED